MDLAIAAAAVFLGHLVRGTTGFGSSLVAVPVLAWVFGPATAIFISCGLDLLGGVVLVPTVRNSVRMPLALAVFLPMVLGQHLGTELLVSLPVHTIRVLLGSVVGLFGLDLLYRPVRPGRGELSDLPEERGGLLALGSLAGLCGGVMQGIVGASGPPIVLFMRRYFQDGFFRAQLIAIFFMGSLTVLPMLVLKGAVPADATVTLAEMVLPMILGINVGKRLAGRVPPVTFGRLVGGLLVSAGFGLVLS